MSGAYAPHIRSSLPFRDARWYHTTDMDKNAVRRDALKFLQKHKVAVLATVSENGEPQAATVTCVVDDDFNLYFITRKGTRKFTNIVRDPKVALVIGTEENMPATVQMHGKAEILTDPLHYMIMFMDRQTNIEEAVWWPLLKRGDKDFAYIKVVPTWLRWLNMDVTGYPETAQEDYHEIIS